MAERAAFRAHGTAGSRIWAEAVTFYPGNAHCGGGTGPQINRDDLFNALVQWVEKDAAPEYIVASQALANGAARTRKICRYPDEARYTGSGSTDDQNNFKCVANRKEPEDLRADSVLGDR